MSNPTEILPRTSVAAVAWSYASIDYISIFIQDVSGGIRESRYNGQDHSWSDKSVITNQGGIPKPKLYSPLTAITVNSGTSIRLYYLAVDNVVKELCQNNGGDWYPGDMNKHIFTASPVSRLAAIGESGYNRQSIYYQRTNGEISEIRRNEYGWNAGKSFGDKPLIGTGLTAVVVQIAHSTSTGINVFYQTADGNLAQIVHDDDSNWHNGDLPKTYSAAAATNFAAFAYGTNKNPMTQLFFLDKVNTICEAGYYSDSWKPGTNHPGRTLAVPGSDIAVIRKGTVENADSADIIKYYIQDEENQIQEYHWEKGWEDWKKTVIPTGSLQ